MQSTQERITTSANSGFIFPTATKPFRDQDLLDAIHLALQRDSAALEQQAAIHDLQERYHALTAREREVMALVLCGMLNKQIADEIGANRDVGIAHRNDAGLLHAHASRVNLSLAEAAGCIEKCITLKPIDKPGHGRESEANVRGNARHDKVLAPCSLDRIDDALVVPLVDRGAFDDRRAVQNLGALGDKRSPHFLDRRGHDNGHFECHHRSRQTNDVGPKLLPACEPSAKYATQISGSIETPPQHFWRLC